jgi:multidrug efflux system membrane fusion protein
VCSSDLLRTPFAGMIDTVEIEPGEWVQGGTPVASLLALDPILVKIEVSERDVGYFAPGGKARVTLVTGQSLEGTISFIAREASAQTRTFPVEVTLANGDYKLPAGMTAQVELLAPPVRAVTVPRSVITLSDEGDLGLRVVDDDDIAAFAPVAIVDDTPDGLVVTGVPSGSRIVVAGQDLIRDGDKVKTVEEAQVTE